MPTTHSMILHETYQYFILFTIPVCYTIRQKSIVLATILQQNVELPVAAVNKTLHHYFTWRKAHPFVCECSVFVMWFAIMLWLSLSAVATEETKPRATKCDIVEKENWRMGKTWLSFRRNKHINMFVPVDVE